MSDSCEHCGNMLPLDEEAYLNFREFTFAELHHLNKHTWYSFPLSMLAALTEAGFDTRHQPEGTIKWSVHHGRHVIASIWVAKHGERTAVLTATEDGNGRLEFHWQPLMSSACREFDPIAMGM